MSNIVPFRPQIRPVLAPPTMSSREIAELVEKRHDNVKRTIETLVERGVFEFPQIEEIPTATKPTTVYHLDKRSSFIVVAQLSPEFTARVVDRWQELEEEKKAGTLALPDFTNPAEAARAWADQVEAVQLLEREQQENRALLAAQAPTVEAHKILAATPGSLSLTEAAKCLGAAPRKFTDWLRRSGWIYRSRGRSERWVPHADKVTAGLMEDVPRSVGPSLGGFVTAQARVTAKGITKLAERLAKQRGKSA
ncbi:phage antirepressor KilAC domain-containing protein [Paracoccus sp. N5]|uniref:phage antirepressor KilAC domain-containing protein n=1 Tax=Paracoccus sp. N5 TaxID=1101189 RepID=UPI0003765601|nr:phage antirepressor KilAC domain-containing protein [Paracoccus sp. N5]